MFKVTHTIAMDLTIKSKIYRINKSVNRTLKNLQPFIKPFLIVFIVYVIAMISIWRSGFSYLDDTGRSLYGYDWSHDFNRYTSSFLAHILNVNMKLTDISPWGQILAMAMLSVASVNITYALCNRKIRLVPLILSTFLGLMPFSIGCWVYKFDAPFMAFAILISTIPIVSMLRVKKNDWKSVVRFIALTAVCVLLVLTSYQAASGIIIVLALGVLLTTLLKNDKKEILKTLKITGIGVIAYLLSCFIFKFILPSPQGYREVEMLGLGNIVSGLINNINTISHVYISSMNIEWKVLLGLSIIVLLITTAVKSKKRGLKKAIDPALIIIFISVALPLAYGIYLLLENGPNSIADWGRYMIGQGSVLAVLFVVQADLFSRKARVEYITMLPAFTLLYSFIIFTLSFGNALSDQARYRNFLNESLAHELADLNIDYANLKVINNIGLSPVASHVRSQYPIVNYLIDNNQYGLGPGSWGTIYLRDYSRLKLLYDEKMDCAPLKNLKETSFFSIQYDNNKRNICVTVK